MMDAATNDYRNSKHQKEIKALYIYLRNKYPNNKLIPTKNKRPAEGYMKYRGDSWTWEKFENYNKWSVDLDVSIILKDMFVLDFDDRALIDNFEAMFPILKAVPCEDTLKGRHYFFKRNEGLDIYDGATQIKDLKLDFKTISRTGTGGLIAVCPSKNKKWIRPLYNYDLIDMPDNLVKYIQDNTRPLSDFITPIQSTSYKIPKQHDYSVDFIKKIVNILNVKRADDYGTWIKVCWALKGEDEDDNLYDTWVEFSAKSDKYNEESVQNTWDKAKSKGEKTYNAYSLRRWAKEDNPEQYKQLCSEDIAPLLKESSLTKAHADIAEVFKRLFADPFVCEEGVDWYEFIDNKWKLTKNPVNVKNHLANNLSDIYKKFGVSTIRDLDEDMSAEERGNEFSKAEKYFTIARELRMTPFQANILKQCERLCKKSKEEFSDLFNSKENLIAFTNGVYELDTGTFREIEPEDMINFNTGYDYIPYIDNDIREDIYDFYWSIFEDSEMIEYCINVDAYNLSGNKYLENFWVHTGMGGNGKGVKNTLLSTTFGEDLYYDAPSDLFTFKGLSDGKGANSYLQKIKGKRMVVVSEVKTTDKVNSDIVKSITGNDKITTRGLYKEAESFKPQCGITFQMNKLLEIDESGDSLKRRLRVIDFPFKFVDNPVKSYERPLDNTLKEKFRDIRYAQQYMLILLDHYRDNIKGNKIFSVPEKVKVSTEETCNENDLITTYINEALEYTGSENDKIRLADLFKDFSKHNIGCGIKITYFRQVLKRDYNVGYPHQTNRSPYLFEYSYRVDDNISENTDSVY